MIFSTYPLVQAEDWWSPTRTEVISVILQLVLKLKNVLSNKICGIAQALRNTGESLSRKGVDVKSAVMTSNLWC